MTTSSGARETSTKIPAGANKISTSYNWFDEIDSTNDYLLAKMPPAAGESRVAVARHQSAGRGRRGRTWQSSPTSSICLSMAYTFANQPENLAAVTLSVGASIAETLEGLGADGVALKWPNDLMIHDAKLGGILTERHRSKSENPTIVVGVGLNIDLKRNSQAFVATSLDRKIGDLVDCLRNVPSFDELANSLIDSLHGALARFEVRGFTAFEETWRSYDWLHGKTVRIAVSDESSVGICEGIDADGALKLITSEGIRRFTSGSVTVQKRSNTMSAI